MKIQEKKKKAMDAIVYHICSIGKNVNIINIDSSISGFVIDFESEVKFKKEHVDSLNASFDADEVLKKVCQVSNLSGAHRNGDSSSDMISRLDIIWFNSPKEFKQHLKFLEEAIKRDHRKIGQSMELFHLQEESPGQVYWHPNGWTVFLLLQEYIREKLHSFNYREVNTPLLVRDDLYKKSGHLQKFGESNMFLSEAYGNKYAMKPMACPSHIQIFNRKVRSYKDLPLRMSEFGCCMRRESHGSLHGIMRVSSMTQDDGHIFCTNEQVESEVIDLCLLIANVYEELGFSDCYILLSDRPEQRVGSDSVWDKAEQALKNACDYAGVSWKINSGEGAFYGPKLEFILKDAIGREWQCGTIQLDFNLPERLGATYVDQNGELVNPVMIHRAVLGSIERFMGVYIEHTIGKLPLWLAPVQMIVSGISDAHLEYAESIVKKLDSLGIRSELDSRNEKIGFKLRSAIDRKIPLFVILGDKEIESRSVSFRKMGVKDSFSTSLDEFIIDLVNKVQSRSLEY